MLPGMFVKDRRVVVHESVYLFIYIHANKHNIHIN